MSSYLSDLKNTAVSLVNPALWLPLVSAHFLDWLFVILGFLVFAFYFESAEPFHRQFALNDVRIMHPYAEVETISGGLCLLLVSVIPIATIIFISFWFELSWIGRAKYKYLREMKSLNGKSGNSQPHFNSENSSSTRYSIIDTIWRAFSDTSRVEPTSLLYLLHQSLLALCVTLITNGIVTDILKNWIGNPRPDFIDRCQPDYEKAEEILRGNPLYTGNGDYPYNALFDVSICTRTDASMLQDGFRSTPSGHSSFSFAGLGFLTLWLFGQFSLLNGFPSYFSSISGMWRSSDGTRGDLSANVAPNPANFGNSYLFDTFVKTRNGYFHRMRTQLAFLCLIPVCLAVFIAVSRTRDYRHHNFDIMFGSSIGMLFAYLFYRRYFPALTAEDCFVPNLIVTYERDSVPQVPYHPVTGSEADVPETSDADQELSSMV